MKVHTYTRSKHMVDCLQVVVYVLILSYSVNRNTSCTEYEENWWCGETHLAQNMKKTGGVLVPSDDQNKALNVQICRK